jgi:hypothetical protein
VIIVFVYHFVSNSGLCIVSRNSLVRIVTCYGMGSPGFESRWARDFPHTSRPSLPYNGYRVLPGGKAAGVWAWPLTPFRAGVRKRVELFLYSPFGTSWPVLGWILPLPSVFKILLSLSCIAIFKLVSFQTRWTHSSPETCRSLHSVMLSRGDIWSDRYLLSLSLEELG